MTSAPSAGRVLINRYALAEVIGHGPASVVWKAWDEQSRRDVAIKEIQLRRAPDDLESAVVMKKVLRDAREAAALRLPGAVPVIDVFEDAGSVCVVMELFAGPTLAEVVADGGPLAPERAAQIGHDLLTTLEAAHAQRTLHRGVSPSNVVLPEGGAAQLSDFAVSSSVLPGGDPALSSFSAPEQTSTTGASPAADLWALGATLRFAVAATGPGDDPPAGGSEDAEAGPLQPMFDALLADDPGARPDAAATRRLLDAATGKAPEPAPTPDVSAAPESDAEEAAAEEAATEETATEETRTTREPWFFPVPVEVVPGSELELLAVEPDRPPPPPANAVNRWRTLGIAVMTVGLCAFMLTLVSTREGRSVRLGDSQEVVVPPDWFRYTDPHTGFSLSRPPDWPVTDHGTVTDFTDPETGAFFRVDTDAPLDASPEETWQRLERALSEHDGTYERVRLVPTEFLDRPASIWEYRYVEDGKEMQIVQLGFYAADRPMVLRFQAEADDWDRYQPDVAALESSFRTPR